MESTRSSDCLAQSDEIRTPAGGRPSLGGKWAPGAAGAALDTNHHTNLEAESRVNKDLGQTSLIDERPVRCSADTTLVLSSDVLADQAVRGIIDDWLVPSLVEQFLRDQMELSDSSQEDHN